MPSHPFAFLARMRAFLLVLAAGMLLTGMLAFWVKNLIRQDADTELAQTVELATLQIETRLKEQTATMRGLQAAFHANPALAHSTITAILENQNILLRQPGFVAIGFARPLERQQVEEFLASMHQGRDGKEAAPNYRIQPETGQPRLQPIEYVYPRTPTAGIYLGFDLLSLSANRTLLGISREDRRAIVTPPYRLDEQTEAAYSFMQHFPVHAPPEEMATAQNQPARYLGSFTAIYRIDQLLKSLDLHSPVHIARLRMFDTGGTLDRQTRQPEQLLFESTGAAKTAEADWLCNSKLVNLPGRQWRLEMCATPGQIMPQHQDKPWFAWLLGTCVSLLTGGIAQSKKRATDLARKLADDITADLRRREIRQRKLALLADVTSDFIAIRDQHGRIEYINPAAQRHFGRDDQMLLGASAPLLLSAEAGIPSEPLHAHGTHCGSDGAVRHYDIIVLPLCDPYGQYEGSAMLAREVTQQYEENQSLRCHNEYLSDLLSLSSDLVWEHDGNSCFTSISGKLFDKHGISPPLGESFLHLAGEDSWERYHPLVMARQAYADFIFPLHIGNASCVISFSGKPVFDASGLFVGYHGCGRDITAMQHDHAQILNGYHHLVAMFESISDGIITTDLAGRIDYMNPVAIALTGRELEEARHQQAGIIFQVIDPASRLPLPPLHQQVLANAPDSRQCRNSILLNHFGLTFSIQEAAAVIRGKTGEPIGSVVVFRDQSRWSPEKA